MFKSFSVHYSIMYVHASWGKCSCYNIVLDDAKKGEAELIGTDTITAGVLIKKRNPFSLLFPELTLEERIEKWGDKLIKEAEEKRQKLNGNSDSEYNKKWANAALLTPVEENESYPYALVAEVKYFYNKKYKKGATECDILI